MKTIGYSFEDAATANAVILITMIIVFPLSAALSDRIGRKPILVLGTIGLAIFPYPLFMVLEHMNVTYSLVAMSGFAVVIGFYLGPVPAVLVELFPTRVRFTGVALSYNVSAAIFGGTAPMVGMALVEYTGDKLAITYYLSALAIFTLITLRAFKETNRQCLTVTKGEKKPLAAARIEVEV